MIQRHSAAEFDLVDIGANLTHDSFDHDRGAVIRRAIRAGVAQFVIAGSTVQQSTQAAELAAALNDEAGGRRFFATAGIHPHRASEFDAGSIARLGALCAREVVVSIGECGLDYFRDYSSKAEQRGAFAAQLALAVDNGLPVYLHQRDAHADFVAILREHLPDLSRAVAHCITGEGSELDCYLDLGLYVGITGWICDQQGGMQLREVVSRIPPERLMVETDSPYLQPRDLEPRPRTRRNEPANLPHVLAAVAAARGETAEALAVSTTRAARRFFALPAPPASSDDGTPGE